MEELVGGFSDLASYSIIITFLCVIGLWKIFEKAGEKGWKSIIPLYNLIVMYKLIGLNPWLLLLYLVPVANIIIAIIYCNKLAVAFGKGLGYTLGMIFLGPIFIMILGFGNAEYVGPKSDN